MCTKQEQKWFTAGWASLMVVFVLQAGSGLWFFSKMDSKVNANTIARTEGGRFTQAEGTIHQFQIDTLIKLAATDKITHRETNKKLEAIHDEIEKLVIEVRTHNHTKPTGQFLYP